MPGKIKVKVLAGRNLPVMDRASDTTDAFVEIKFGGVTHKTDVCRKSLNPHWSSTEWYRFEVEESELQDEPLQLRLMDHDTYSANDAIGKVVISLAPLLAREANNVKGTGTPGGAVLSGWIPVFDTMHGIRGELNVIVKVELLSDFNKYKTSSCGVQFFHCTMIPPGYRATSVHGFVEELVVNDDPEYQWIDKIRTPRASNEARQVAFIKLSNQVQRLVGLKAAELGANAVVGYQQDFDLEGEAGVVARAIGTAVSLTPLPTPSQPMNISCTPQQLKKCLDILATDDESVTDLSQYYSTHREELQKMLSILNPKAPSMLDEPEAGDDDDDKLDRGRAASINSYVGSVSFYQEEDIAHKSLRHLSEDQTDLNRLLNKKDDSDSDSSGPIQKIKKIKKNFFSRKFARRKSDNKDDNVSIKSNVSDSSRLSLGDIKNELKKLKLKTPKFRKVVANKEDEGVGMASILARSVIHVHTSLACIAETQDSEHSPSSTMRRTSESEPTINMSDEENQKKTAEYESNNENEKKIPEIHFTSLNNISSDKVDEKEPVRRISESCPTSPMAGRSESLLKLPGDKGYFGSVSSALSGESSMYSSSDEDDESSEKSDIAEVLETTTSVVKSVLNHEVNPAIVAQMDRKLSILQNSVPNIDDVKRASDIESIIEESNSQDIDQILPPVITNPIEEQKNELLENKAEPARNDPSTSASPEKCVTKSNSHYIKIHNPFANKKTSKSISAPSSPTEIRGFVGRSSKRIRDQLTKLTKSNMIKSLSHYSLLPKRKQEKSLSQPGSSSDVPSRVPSETVLGSHFLSYSDLLSLDRDRLNSSKLCKSDEFDRSKVSMYIGSEPVSRSSLSGPSFLHHGRDEHDHNHKKERSALKPTGLIHTAMETILIDKVDTLLLPASPEPTVNTKFFDDVSEKLVEHKNREFDSKMKMGQVQTCTGSTTPRIVAVTPKRLSDDYTNNKLEIPVSKSSTHTSMETIHFEKPDAFSDSSSPKDTEHTAEEKHDKSKFKLPKLDTNIKHTIIDKVHSVLPKTPEIHLDNIFHRKHSRGDVKAGGLVHTAMQTMLMDRAQSMIPDTPEPIPIHSENLFDEKRGKRDRHDSTGLVHSAMEMILMDKVQAVLPETSEPVPIHLVNSANSSKEMKGKDNKESTGLIHSAMETILMDKVQAVLPETSEPAPIHLDNLSVHSNDSQEMKVPGNRKESTGLIHSAMETILMDKVQAVLPQTSEPVPIHLNNSSDNTNQDIKQRNKDAKRGSKDSTGLIHSAMQTILMDKVQSVLPESAEPVPIHLDSIPEKSHNTEEMKQTGLMHSAMETILIDTMQNILGPDPQVSQKEAEILKTDKFQVKSDKDKVENAENSKSDSLDPDAKETIIIDRTTTMFPKEITIPNSTPGQNSVVNSKSKESERSDDLAVGTSLTDGSKTVDIPTADIKDSEKLNTSPDDVKSETKTTDKIISLDTLANVSLPKEPNDIVPSKTESQKLQEIQTLSKDEPKPKKLIRQDSIHSIAESKMSNENLSNIAQSNVTRPLVLQHFHPILSGQLETIPSMSESSFERSLDNESFETNSVSVCGNLHAACGFDRDRDRGDKDRGSPRHARHESYGGKEPVGSTYAQNASLNSTSTPMGIHRRSSDSDLSVTPKGGSLNTSAGNVGSGGGAILKPSMNSNNLDMLEYPFLTMKEYPPGFIVHIGGTVMSRAVRVVEGSGGGGAAWPDLRTELRAHARALRCNAVIAYSEHVAICDDVCVLSASGTAAVINLDCDFNAEIDQNVTVTNTNKHEDEDVCSIAHVPYSPGSGPYRAELSTCGGCRRVRVPAVLLATCEKPSRLGAYSKAVTLTAVAGRVRRAAGGEAGARELSDQLPFLEYELHKLLLAKLRMQGANAIFSLSTQIAVGERCILALASGLACKLTALPPPSPPKIKASENDKEAIEIQRTLWDTFVANRAANGFDAVLPEISTISSSTAPEPPALDLAGDKDACVLELDEAEDVETARLLCVRRPPLAAWTPTLKPQKQPPLAFVQVSRGRLSLSCGGSVCAERCVSRALDAVAYKLRRVAPVAVHSNIHLDLPEDEIQLVLSGTAIPLIDPTKPESHESSQAPVNNNHNAGDADDDIFELDEEQLVKKNQVIPEVVEKETVNGQVSSGAVCVTSLCACAGSARCVRVCALRLLFVRETTAVREQGGLSGFLHTFTCEVMAIVRAYTAALGGNALTSFYITQLMLQDNAHKNQGQCLLSVGGDVVHVTY